MTRRMISTPRCTYELLEDGSLRPHPALSKELREALLYPPAPRDQVEADLLEAEAPTAGKQPGPASGKLGPWADAKPTS